MAVGTAMSDTSPIVGHNMWQLGRLCQTQVLLSDVTWGSWDGYVRHKSFCRTQHVAVGTAMSDTSPIVGHNMWQLGRLCQTQVLLSDVTWGSWDGYVRHKSYCRTQCVAVGTAMSDTSPIVGHNM